MRGIDLGSFVEELRKIADGRMGGTSGVGAALSDAPGKPAGADLSVGGGASTAPPPIAPKAPTSGPMMPSAVAPKSPTPNATAVGV